MHWMSDIDKLREVLFLLDIFCYFVIIFSLFAAMQRSMFISFVSHICSLWTTQLRITNDLKRYDCDYLNW